MTVKGLTFGLISQNLVHGPCRFGAARFSNLPGRHPGHRLFRRHRMQHDRARGDARAMANLDIAQDLGAGADQHAVANLRVAIATFLAGAAQRHVLQHRHIIINDGRHADDKAGGVIQEYALADLGGWMNVGLKHFRGAALQEQSKVEQEERVKTAIEQALAEMG